MPFNGAFTVSSPANNITDMVITDTSTGSDGNLTGRTIYLYQANGQLLGSAVSWPIGDGPITLSNVLSKDYSLNITVIWASSAPLASPSTYTYSLVTTFVGYTNNFNYSLCQQVAAGNPPLQADANFGDNFYSMFLYVKQAILSTNFSDQYSAQFFLTRANYKIQNQTLFF